jgi:hypothetical protein
MHSPKKNDHKNNTHPHPRKTFFKLLNFEWIVWQDSIIKLDAFQDMALITTIVPGVKLPEWHNFRLQVTVTIKR